MHVPVLLQEVLDGLALSPNDTVIDGTVGGGGHASAILDVTAPNGTLIGFDRDRSTLLETEEKLDSYGDRFIGVHDSYANMENHDAVKAAGSVQGILVDLGLSSIQIDDGSRGFAFRFDGPLDMRFDQLSGPTAADLLNSQSEEELRRLLWEFGEERQSGRIARAIVARREEEPFKQTSDLVEVVESVIRRRPGKMHPATRTFQALRIAVNQELEQLELFLPKAVEQLASGGRLAVISFHSLEDRIVKHFFKQAARAWEPAPADPSGRRELQPTIRLITKKPIIPSEEEIAENPRARSAKMRIVEKI